MSRLLCRPFAPVLFLALTLLLTLPFSLLAAPSVALPELDDAVRAKLSGSLQMQLEAKQRLARGEWADANLDGWLIRSTPEGARTTADQLVFVHLDAYPTLAQISAMEATGAELILSDWVPPLENHPNGFFLARVPVNRIDQLAALPFVRRLGNGEDVLAPQNDAARLLTGVEDAVAEYGAVYNEGSGVRVAVLDSGIDLDHPDFPDPAYAVDYSEWPDSNLTVNNTVSGHGTHVAGTVLGRGEAYDRYTGMAPAAELVFLKIGNDAEALETAAGVAHSFIAAADYYDCDVATMSYGYYNEFMDGSAENEQAVDYAFGQGTLVFVSAGNNHGDAGHASFSVPAGATSGFYALDVSPFAGGQPLLVNVICQDGPDTDVRTLFDVTLYDEMFQELPATASAQQQSPRGTEGRYILGDDPLPNGGTIRYISITNNGDSEQTFHLYVGVQTLGPYNVGYEFSAPDPANTIGSPALADHAIAVAAYNSTLEWVDYEGDLNTRSGAEGDIAYFSSIGPRIDGVQKPDIAAPGRYIASALDGDVPSWQPGGGFDSLILPDSDDPDGTPGHYLMLQGTSMACPAASGAVAAVLGNYLAVAPDIEFDPAEVRQVLLDNAVADAFTGAVPNTTWGAGKLDVLPLAAFIQASVEEDGGNTGLPEEFRIAATYPNPFNASAVAVVDLPSPARLRVTLLNVLGQEVGTVADGVYGAGRHAVALDASRLASGTYLLRASTGSGAVRTQRVTVVK